MAGPGDPVPEGGGSKPRRRWRWLLTGVALLPLLLFGLSNLWLATAPGRSWVAGGFRRFTGLEARVGPSSWSPWGGVTLRRVELLAPPPLGEALEGPLLAVEKLRVRPYWRPLAKGALMPRSVEVEGPRLRLPVELLAHLAAGPAAVTVPLAPAAGELAATTAAPPGPGGQAVASVGGQGGAAPSGATATAGGASGSPADGGAKPDGEATGVRPPVTGVGADERRPTVWLRVRGGSLWLGQAAGHRTWLQAGPIAADLPIAGRAADGALAVEALQVAGEEVGEARLPVAWRSSVVAVGPWRPVMRGLKSEWSVQLQPAGPLPFVVECRVAPQRVPRRDWGGGWQAAARRTEVAARGGGCLRVPATWQGELRVRATGVSCGAAGQAEFACDESVLWLVARHGALTVPEARAVGEAGSLLGNGWLFPDGRLAANARLVVPRDTAAALQQRHAALLAPAAFRPLETPDRWALDARLGGTLAEPWVEFGDGPTQLLKRLLAERDGSAAAREAAAGTGPRH